MDSRTQIARTDHGLVAVRRWRPIFHRYHHTWRRAGRPGREAERVSWRDRAGSEPLQGTLKRPFHFGAALERMTQICVSLTEETTAGVVERMQELSGIADLFEVRADMVLDLDLLTILRARTRPIMLTCRAAAEGGRMDDDDPRRRMTLPEAGRRGFDYVDVEYRSAFTEVMVEKAGRGLIVSYHDLKSPPEDLDGFYAAMRERGADVV